MDIKYTYADDVEIDVLDVDEIDKQLLSVFSCGNESLDEFLHDKAETDSSKTFVFVDVNQQAVVAFASIACSAIMYAIENDSGSILFSLERFGLTSAIEIKYFAVDKRYRHLRYSDAAPKTRITLSSNLFRYLIDHILDIAEKHIGAEYIVLYSVPKAKTFYERNMFHSFDQSMFGNSDPYLDGCIPMYMKI